MAPDTVEDIMELNVDGTKGKKAGHEELGKGVTKAWHIFGYLKRDILMDQMSEEGRGDVRGT